MDLDQFHGFASSLGNFVRSLSLVVALCLSWFCRLGIVTAVAIWSLFPENPYILPIFGWLFSIPCFYYVVATPQYAVSARFVLLAYNLTCLFW